MVLKGPSLNTKPPEEILRDPLLQTDSLGSRSDNSGKTTVTNWSNAVALTAAAGSSQHASLAPSPSLPGGAPGAAGAGGGGGQAAAKPRMEVVCVIDLHLQQQLQDRRKAFEEVKFACAIMGQHNVQVRYQGTFIHCPILL